MSRFLSDRFASLEAYVPGEQPQDMQYIKLNTNESPYPPSPSVRRRLMDGEIEALQLYPNPDYTRLRQLLADACGVGRENILLGNGSDEVLSMAFLAFCDGTYGAVFPDVTYGFYPVFARLYGIPFREQPLREDFTVDPADYMKNDAMVVLANPNAPTGLSLPLETVEAILRANPDRVVVVDESYVDFGGVSAAPLTAKYDNLLVVQTFSKSRSMAGARLGFGVACRCLIEDLEKMRYSINPYNINRLTAAAGEAALEDAAYYQDNCRRIMQTREDTARAMAAMGFTLTRSQGNFLFARHPKTGGGELYQALRDRGVLVRWFNRPRTADWLRITVGTPEQMDALLQTLKQILEG